MKIKELFDSRDKKKRLSHIINLVILACSDGSLDKSEMDLIFQIGIKGGLTPDELNRIFSRPDSINFHPPESYRERIEQLYDMVLVMMADGEIYENEMRVCKTISIKLGFKPQIIDKMVNNIIKLIADGIVAEMAIERLVQGA